MSTNPTLTVQSDAELLGDIAREVDAFGFAASVVDTGGGVLAAAVNLHDRMVTVTVHEGELIVAAEDVDGAIGPEDGTVLTIAEAVAACLVQRINLGEL